ncbi:MAG: hypothetical protein ABSG31_16145 [Tepidisphaeraceae bacterium]|jgi:hypothetical protein
MAEAITDIEMVNAILEDVDYPQADLWRTTEQIDNAVFDRFDVRLGTVQTDKLLKELVFRGDCIRRDVWMKPME